MAKPLGFKIIPHTAEMGLEFWGKDLEQLFENAARGLLAVYGNVSVSSNEKKVVLLKSGDPESLMVSWLNEIIYLVSAQSWIPSQGKILSADTQTLKAEMYGGKIPGGVHLAREVKAATYHGLKIERDGHRLKAKVIFDV
ncbi:MAG: archease [Elusimicrobia bacterium]|nr:archease [Elusimicrobiota bacterium]